MRGESIADADETTIYSGTAKQIRTATATWAGMVMGHVFFYYFSENRKQPFTQRSSPQKTNLGTATDILSISVVGIP